MIENGDMFNDEKGVETSEKKRPIGFGVEGKYGAFRNADDTTNYCSRLHYGGQMPLKHVHETAKRSGNANASLDTSFSFLSVWWVLTESASKRHAKIDEQMIRAILILTHSTEEHNLENTTKQNLLQRTS